MGIVMDHAYYSSTEPSYRLVVYTAPISDMSSTVYSLNIPLASELIKTRESMRSLRIEQYLCRILNQLPEKPLISGIDVLFNPSYKIDVMAVLISAYKRKPFSLIWPGKYENGMLIYGEENYSDYQTFKINNYDIVCVI